MTIYTITAIPHYPASRITTLDAPRCFGYFSTEPAARNEAAANASGLDECYYNWLLIEAFEEGVHPLAREVQWYRWEGKMDGRWEETVKPEWSVGITNWALG